MTYQVDRTALNGAKARIRRTTWAERRIFNTWWRPFPYLFCQWEVEWTYAPDSLWSVSDNEPFWNYGGSYVFYRSAIKQFQMIRASQEAYT